ncbi:MAG: hypothetical protein ABI361_04915 [Nitrososphaera sp.]
MTHLGIDIDQFVLFTIYPAAAFFAIGFASKKTKMKQIVMYLLQAATCFGFSIAYFAFVPNGGAQGLAVVLAMFGVLLLFMARKQKIQPAEQSVE